MRRDSSDEAGGSYRAPISDDQHELIWRRIIETSQQWAVPCDGEVFWSDVALASRLFDLKRVSTTRVIKDDTALLRHCADLAAEHRVVKEMRGRPESFCWRLLRVRITQRACWWKHCIPGEPSRAEIESGEWYTIVLPESIPAQLRAQIHDAANAAFSRAEKGICNLKGEGRFKGRSRLDVWYFSIIRNLFIDQYRDEEQARSRLVPLDDDERAWAGEDADSDEQVPVAAPYDLTEPEVLDGEAVRLAKRAIQLWAARTARDLEHERLHAEILHKAYIEELKPREIAAQYGPPVDANYVSDKKLAFKKSPEGHMLSAELHARLLLYLQPEPRVVAASGEAT